MYKQEKTRFTIGLFGLILFSFVISACHPIHGFLESEFVLSPESRLPVWLSQLSEDYERDSIEVYLQYYSSPFNTDNAVLLAKDNNGKTIIKVSGKSEFHSETLKKRNSSGGYNRDSYPHYVIITINGVTEVIEHRKMEPIFYISDIEAF